MNDNIKLLTHITCTFIHYFLLFETKIVRHMVGVCLWGEKWHPNPVRTTHCFSYASPKEKGSLNYILKLFLGKFNSCLWKWLPPNTSTICILQCPTFSKARSFDRKYITIKRFITFNSKYLCEH